ncbi:MAG TPA: hypothetical protein VEF33_03540, partial [Syntrophales bacterium]|nr:hypothetical protein [Syntrophales bacterium]
ASGFPVSPFWKKYFTVSGYAYLFVAFACFLNVYLHELVNNGPNILPWIVDLIGLGSMVPQEWITPNLGTLKALNPIMTLGGAVAALFLLGRMSKQYDIPPSVRRGQYLIISAISFVFLVIL